MGASNFHQLLNGAGGLGERSARITLLRQPSWTLPVGGKGAGGCRPGRSFWGAPPWTAPGDHPRWLPPGGRQSGGGVAGAGTGVRRPGPRPGAPQAGGHVPAALGGQAARALCPPAVPLLPSRGGRASTPSSCWPGLPLTSRTWRKCPWAGLEPVPQGPAALAFLSLGRLPRDHRERKPGKPGGGREPPCGTPCPSRPAPAAGRASEVTSQRQVACRLAAAHTRTPGC